MLTGRFKSHTERLLSPLAMRLASAGVSPTALTWTGLGLVAASCAILLATRRILLFCVLAGFASLFDAIDGAVARAAGRTTKSGAYLDAMCDRLGEAMIVVSVARVTGLWLLSCLVIVGTLLVSYAKARAAMEVPVSNHEWPDLMERTERGIVFLCGLATSQWLPWRPLGRDLFWWTLAGLTVLIYATAIQRMRRAVRLIRSRG